jgi:hypothetical protein
MKIPKLATAITALLIGASQSATAGTVSPIQSGARPFGLDPIANVELAGSDTQAMDFSENALPDLQDAVNNTLTENQPLDITSIALDPNDLRLTENSDVRVYFVGEGAGYRNSFGVYTGDSTDKLSGDASLIFPDASTSGSYLNPTESEYRSRRAPVAEGDFVDLGNFEADTQLNLFLIANGANGGKTTFYTDGSLNPDGIEHFVVLATPDSPYLLVGAEDLLGGGDEDYNDIVVAIDVGVQNAKQLISKAAPLPGPIAALLGPLAWMAWAGFRRRARA